MAGASDFFISELSISALGTIWPLIQWVLVAEVWAGLSLPLLMKFRICGAIPPVPCMPSCHAQGQLYLYSILYTALNNGVSEYQSVKRAYLCLLRCLTWAWFCSGTEEPEFMSGLTPDGRTRWVAWWFKLFVWRLFGFKVFCHTVHTFHVKNVVWMHGDMVMFVIVVCMFYPWQYRVVWNKLMVWKVIPI